jgi:hypothetical protein
MRRFTGVLSALTRTIFANNEKEKIQLQRERENEREGGRDYEREE